MALDGALLPYRNTAGFKELLGPVAPHRSEAGDERD